MPVQKSSLVEATRITACLEAAVEKLEVLGLLGTDESHAGLSQMRNDETGHLLAQQGSLMQRFQERINARRSLEGSSKLVYEDNERQIEQTAQALRQATKTVTRNLEESVALASNYAKIHTAAASLADLLRRTMGDLQQPEPRFQTLQSRVDSEQTRLAHMQSVLERERELSQSTSRQRDQVHTERLEMQAQLAQKDQAIADLKERIADQRTEVTVQLRYMSKESAAAAACQERVQRRAAGELVTRIAEVERQLEVERQAHDTLMALMTAKVERLDERIGEAEAKYMTDVAERTKNVESLHEGREGLLVAIRELEERYDRDIARRALHAEAARAREEAIAARKAAQERDERAVILLQCAYRTHKARATLLEAKNPKKKKGKGAAKKKK